MADPKRWQSEADRLANEFIAAGDPTGWFDKLYAAGESGEVTMAWDHEAPHPLLAGWLTGGRRPDPASLAVNDASGPAPTTIPASTEAGPAPTTAVPVSTEAGPAPTTAVPVSTEAVPAPTTTGSASTTGPASVTGSASTSGPAPTADTLPPASGPHPTAVVIGCGLGADAEFLAASGYDVTAFDLSETVIRAARQRHQDSPVRYVVADLLALPAGWARAFDLVVEIYTVQAVPPSIRPEMTAAVGDLVAPGGTLLVIQGVLPDDDDGSGPPWQLTRDQIEAFGDAELQEVGVRDPADGRRRTWQAEFRRR